VAGLSGTTPCVTSPLLADKGRKKRKKENEHTLLKSLSRSNEMETQKVKGI
jgi:hypothetical protein